MSGLVPAGLTPVAIFPAGAIPQSVPATSIIWSEALAAAGKRRKRSAYHMSSKDLSYSAQQPYVPYYYEGEVLNRAFACVYI